MAGKILFGKHLHQGCYIYSAFCDFVSNSRYVTLLERQLEHFAEDSKIQLQRPFNAFNAVLGLSFNLAASIWGTSHAAEKKKSSFSDNFTF